MIALKAQLCKFHDGQIIWISLYLRAHHGYFAAGQIVALIGFLNGFPGIDACCRLNSQTAACTETDLVASVTGVSVSVSSFQYDDKAILTFQQNMQRPGRSKACTS